jgi:mannose-1-phosphate guanylyltransferase
MLPLTRRITGDDRPKQFCRIIGTNSLLDETRRRVTLTIPEDRVSYVLTQKHERFFADALAEASAQNLIVQPRNAGTAPAILYSLSRLALSNANDLVAFFPSDHYFSDDDAFMAEVEAAFDIASRRPDVVVLLGIEPEHADKEYGWIEPYPPRAFTEGPRFARVHRFWEKPSTDLARELMSRGCLWNIFVMVGAVSAFTRMIRLATPRLFAKFSRISPAMGTTTEGHAIRYL